MKLDKPTVIVETSEYRVVTRTAYAGSREYDVIIEKVQKDAMDQTGWVKVESFRICPGRDGDATSLFLLHLVLEKLLRLQETGKALYLAGLWTAEGVEPREADRLWHALGFALNLPPGTATAAGVGSKS